MDADAQLQPGSARDWGFTIAAEDRELPNMRPSEFASGQVASTREPACRFFSTSPHVGSHRCR